MLLKMIRYIKGYIRIRITGYSTERFLNACSHKGIVLWGLTPVNRAYEMNIETKGFRQLKPIIRKTGTKVVIVGRFGLPFFLHKYRKRKLFFAGAFLSVALIFLMSRYIWNIDIRGNLSYTDETLLRFLASTEVTNGMPVSEVDCARIVKDIRKEYNDIIWVSASIKGTRLIIQVKENEDSLPAMDMAGADTAGTAGAESESGEAGNGEAQAMDIIADQDCVITRIVPRSGIPMVKEGQEVKAGDLLVSGQVPVLDDAGTVIAYQYHKADADIQGRTSVEYQDETDLAYMVKEYMDVEKIEYTLKIGSYFLRFGSIRNSYDTWEMNGSEKQLCIGENFYLPVICDKRTARPYRPQEKKYSKKELQKILSANFQRYCKDLDKKGVEIIENNVKIYTGSKKAEARGTLTVLTPIGTLAQSQLLEIPVIEEQDETGE